jgi:hypothetical protein
MYIARAMDRGRAAKSVDAIATAIASSNGRDLDKAMKISVADTVRAIKIACDALSM